METKTAKLIKKLKRPSYASAALYQCDPPLCGEEYVVASSVGYGVENDKECLLFASDSDGKITFWSEISGIKRLETLEGSHELAFKDEGYVVI